MSDADTRLENWRDGQLDAAETAALARDLEGPEAQRLYEDFRLMEMLAQSHPEAAKRCIDRVATALSQRRSTVRRRLVRTVGNRLARRRWLLRSVWLAVAAGLLIAVGLFVFSGQHGADVIRDGQPCPDGSQIAVGQNTSSELRWADGSVVTLAGPATAQVVDGRLRLDAGSCRAVISPQGAGRFTVATPHGTASVIGTRFRLRVSGGTALIVDEGHVQLIADGATHECHAGGLALCGPGASSTQTVTATDRRPIGMLWLEQGLRTVDRLPLARELDDPSQSSALANRLDRLADDVIATMDEAGAQGVVVWDAVDGDANRLRLGLVGGFDAFMRRLRDAGLNIGVAIQAVGEDGPDLAGRLALAVAESKARWGIRYALITNYTPDANTAMPLLRAAHPDVLLMPVNGSAAWGLPVHWGADSLDAADAEDACGLGAPIDPARADALLALWRAGAVPLIYAHWLDDDNRAVLRRAAKRIADPP
jgi:ferric-dicitrate binding protein FerR (iron transport regulator)